LRVRGEDGPGRLQRVRVAIDSHEVGAGGRFEERTRVPGSAERGVHEDPPSFQTRDEELHDSVEEDRLMIHVVGPIS
jgi:hypothetical protein